MFEAYFQFGRFVNGDEASKAQFDFLLIKPHFDLSAVSGAQFH